MIYQFCLPLVQEAAYYKTEDSDILADRNYKYKKEISQKTKSKNIKIFKIRRELFRIYEKLEQMFLAVKNIRRYKYCKLKFFKK